MRFTGFRSARQSTGSRVTVGKIVRVEGYSRDGVWDWLGQILLLIHQARRPAKARDFCPRRADSFLDLLFFDLLRRLHIDRHSRDDIGHRSHSYFSIFFFIWLERYLLITSRLKTLKSQ